MRLRSNRSTHGVALLPQCLALVLIVAMAGCTVAPPAPGAAPSAAPAAGLPATSAPAVAAPAVPTAAVKTPVKGGTLKIGKLADVNSLDPVGTLGNGNWPMYFAVYNVLVRYDQNMKPQPELAESWEFSPDNLTLTLRLRKGVKFHTGRELVADQIIANLDGYRDPKRSSNLIPLLAAIKEAKAVDQYTVRLTFEKPSPGIFDALDLMFIYDTQVPNDTLKRQGAGTGPFKVDSWDPGNRVRLLRNSDYWRAGRPYLDELILQVTPDEQTMVTSFEAGALDAVDGAGLKEYSRLMQTKRYAGMLGEYSLVLDLLMNVKAPPFDNKLVRQAISYAVDRERIIQTAYAGIGRAVCTPFPPSSPAYDAALDKACSFDLSKAKQLLDQAGFSQGFNAVITIATSVVLGSDVAAQIIQSDLKKIGITTTIEDLAGTAYNQKVAATPSYQIAIHNFGRANKDPASLFGTARVFFAKGNSSNYESPEYTALIEQGATTLDLAQRKETYRKLGQLLLDENFALSLSPRHRAFVTQSFVYGLQKNLDGMVILDDAFIAK